MKGTTEKQKALLDFIKEFIETKHYSPSLGEIKNHFGFKSLSTVHQHLSSLKKKGLITSEKNYARSINITSIPSEIIHIPLVGQFASSHPLDFFSTIDKAYPFHKDEIENPDHTYLLQVRGDALLHEQIKNQDLLLIENCTQLQRKEVGLFALSSGATLLKRYYPEEQFIKLEGITSTSYAPAEIVRPHEIQILGKLIKLSRFF
ncbi:MAG: transcriptional repressor LexA [Rhabdochlamydiaceae bacterium]|nr:transcriptional repressor LexA [Candidatus Amphrikana amoebophyrae]